MGTKMFKLGSFEEELASSMEKGLVSNQLENKFSFDKIAKVADYLSAAAELLDDTGHSTEADMVTKVLARLAGAEDNNASYDLQEDYEDEEIEVPDEIIIEPLDQELFVAPKSSPGNDPLDVDFKTNEIFEKPEYLEFKSIAQKLNAKLAKKKV